MYTEPDESSLAGDLEHIFRVAYRLTGNSPDAEDLAQDVCERALRKAPEFASAEDRRRWLLRVLYNLFVDGRRHNRRSPIVATDAAGESDGAQTSQPADPEDLAVRSDAEVTLMRAWARLEPSQQILLLLRAEGHDLGEIADITEIDKPVLSSRLHRARSSLAKYLEQESSPQPFCSISEKTR